MTFSLPIRSLLLLSLLLPPPALAADQPEPDSTAYLDEIVVTATAKEEPLFQSVRSVTLADFDAIQERSPLSLLDTLDDRIGIWIEKRTTTTSDPVLRGLSGGNILALVDRNTLTTMWGEGGFAGDDMYGKIAAESIERIEVVRGPSSVLYGNNALGGVVNLITREPPLDYAAGPYVAGARAKGGYGTASDYRFGRVETWGASPRLRYILGLSAHKAENMRAGGDKGEIDPSGGEDQSADLKTEFKLADGRYLELSSQVMHRPEVYRSYRPNEVNENDRAGVSLGYRSFMVPPLDEFEWRAYYQVKEDVREWLDSDKRGVAQWDTFSSDMQLTKAPNQAHELTAGLHYQLDVAESPDDEQFTITTTRTGTQKASPDTDWANVGAYLQDQWSLAPRLNLIPSLRYDHFRLEADDNVFHTIPGSTSPDNVATRDPGTYDEDAYTGGLGLLYELAQSCNVLGSWFRGYRLFPPSFGLRQVAYGVLAPNGPLDPVTGDTFELSTRVRGDLLSASVTGYYTDFQNFQQPIPGTYDGMSSYDFDGSGTIDPDESIFVNAANGDAYVKGLELECEVNLGSISPQLHGWRLFPGLMWNYGKMHFPDTAEEPLRHTHPTRGILKLRYDDPKPKNKWWLEFVADIVDRFDEISESRLNGDVGYRSDPQDPSSPLVRDYGLPGYSVFDVRAGYHLAENASITVALDNVFDKLYRTAHSRMDAEGRDLFITLEVRF